MVDSDSDSSIDSLFSVVECTDVCLSTHDDDNVQQKILLSVSRADDHHLLTTTCFSDSESTDESVILSPSAPPGRLWKKVLSGPILNEIDEYFDMFICPMSLEWVEKPVRLHKKYYSKDQLELLVAQAAADPNSFGVFIDPVTRITYPIKMALVVDIAFEKRVTSAMRFEKIVHERFKSNWLCASFQTKNTTPSTSTSTSTSTRSIVDVPSIIDEPIDTDAPTVEPVEPVEPVDTDAPIGSRKKGLIIIPTKDWLNNVGLRVVNYILNHAQNIGWGESLIKGKRTNFFDDNADETWFEKNGILSSYRMVTGRVLRLRFKHFEDAVEAKYGKHSHSNDKTGAEDEDVPAAVSLCLKWFDYKATFDNTPSAKNMRIKKRKIIDKSLEPRAPLGVNLTQLPRSQIARENLLINANNGLVAPTVTTDDNSNVGVETFVSPQTTTDDNSNVSVAAFVSPQTIKKTPDSKGSKSLIESIMNSQSESYMKAMNDNMLQISQILANPRRSYREMLHDYKEAQTNLKDAIDSGDVDDIAFFRDLKKKISDEMKSE